MTTQHTTDDPRTDQLKINMAEHFADHREEYDNGRTHEVVHEDDEVAIVADHRGNELNEWALESEVGRDELRAFFRSAADDILGEQQAHEIFSTADPVIFDRLE